MKLVSIAALAVALAAGSAMAAAPVVAPIATAPAGLKPLAMTIGGRVQQKDGDYTYQWPGTYFDTAFEGQAVYFKVGKGDEILHVTVDGQASAPMVKPAPGLYGVEGLSKGKHTVRIEVVTESQAAPDTFGGFSVAADAKPVALKARARQIEFIGDSHTVGYGNISTTRDCTTDDVWKTTDNSVAFGPVTARHYDADYQINAISGHGIVRNYNGFAGDPVPVAYPYVLLSHDTQYQDAAWQPQIIVIALGTNDFSTPLNAGEKWKTRDELHADYEATYGQFLKDLRARNPKAFFILWATDMADGEIAAEEKKVADQFKASNDNRITFIPFSGLQMTGCHWHPSAGDDQTISKALVGFIDAHPDLWQGK
ncbi:GDSL-type esterase/lipase family protein [Asticcacaulis solisilvae]|uniref:GDSL-type esterase/lipase family protein n=1 Tax=Asticcacaulis solisilvae TaxID=1217274 RepID=UPI003FD77BBA